VVVVQFDHTAHEDLGVHQTELLVQFKWNLFPLLADGSYRLLQELVGYFLVAVLQFPVRDDDRDLARLFEVLEVEVEFQQLNRFLGRVVYFPYELVEQGVD